MFRHADVVSCVYPVAVLNAAFCMTCSLLMLVEDASGYHTECVISICCVVVASLDVVCDELTDCAWNVCL